MKQVAMSASEFEAIEQKLQHLNPEEGISISMVSPERPCGIISGTHPVSWAADFTYANGALTILGHGAFIGGRVEKEVVAKLTSALAEMRKPC
jgi:hypothetical protein